MEIITLDKDIPVLYVTAKSFPAGIMEAHEKLHALVPFSNKRKYFGISRPEKENGSIIYKAAAEELQPDEARKLNLQTMEIRKGKYISRTVKNYAADALLIKSAFENLLKEPGLDPEGYCIEWYVNDTDVKCMIRLK